MGPEMKQMKRIALLSVAVFGVNQLAAEETKEVKVQIQGEVPEGWEVVESTEGPFIEKWVELKSGEKKKIFVRPFVLKPIVKEENEGKTMDPLKLDSGRKLDELLKHQNENLSQTQQDLSEMLTRLRALLATQPQSTTIIK